VLSSRRLIKTKGARRAVVIAPHGGGAPSAWAGIRCRERHPPNTPLPRSAETATAGATSGDFYVPLAKLGHTWPLIAG
jgi:hypothetical protein